MSYNKDYENIAFDAGVIFSYKEFETLSNEFMQGFSCYCKHSPEKIPHYCADYLSKVLGKI